MRRSPAQVTELGGIGKACPCDCSDAEAVAALVRKIGADEGRLDVLVPSAFATPPKLDDAAFRDVGARATPRRASEKEPPSTRAEACHAGLLEAGHGDVGRVPRCEAA